LERRESWIAGSIEGRRGVVRRGGKGTEESIAVKPESCGINMTGRGDAR
jgi:hypothetical protein